VVGLSGTDGLHDLRGEPTQPLIGANGYQPCAEFLSLRHVRQLLSEPVFLARAGDIPARG
jgi:hypothetical protein